MTGEEIKMELEMSNVTDAMGELLVAEENNTVAVHTELFNDATYSQLVGLLFNFMSSQVNNSQLKAHFTVPRGLILFNLSGCHYLATASDISPKLILEQN